MDAVIVKDRSAVGARRRPLIPNAVLGMLIFIVTEAMFFAGLISALTIVRSSAMGGLWPPPGQPRLPVGQTAFNTAALLVSGLLLLFAAWRFRREARSARWPLLASVLLGLTFVALQGVEWVALLKEGLTLTSGAHGGFFYLIIGMHAAHAVAALVALAVCLARLMRGTLEGAFFGAAQAFWYFVVAVWPVLYLRVYF
ncbi:MAG: cytochrome c oxidase subunit 3 [Myxococcaceae bacterium]|nr:cytochrome c oxidase subunit 3 [Myxococcaceae bacterium]